MPFDWKAFEKDINKALDKAEKKTDDQLASRVSSLTRLSDNEVKKLFPTPADVDKLKQLMQIVKSSDSRNKKVLNLTNNIETLAETAIKLLEVLA
ncbi:MAG: hypothetical protein C4538_07375 [Nitrospiraceae bacterium]|nr:MAG: hypothetical protein C4538_07375 [Nitrospiraceae bacterium]